jgi:hypothetical protein
MIFKKLFNFIYYPIVFFGSLVAFYGYKIFILMNGYNGTQMASYLSSFSQDKFGPLNYLTFFYFTIGFAYFINQLLVKFQKKFKNISLSVVVFSLFFVMIYYLANQSYAFFIQEEWLVGAILVGVVSLFNLGVLWEICYLSIHVLSLKIKNLTKVSKKKEK